MQVNSIKPMNRNDKIVIFDKMREDFLMICFTGILSNDCIEIREFP